MLFRRSRFENCAAKLELPAELLIKEPAWEFDKSGRIHLLSTVEDWCNATFGKRKWHFIHTDHGGRCANWIIFKRAHDAVIFKTFWL